MVKLPEFQARRGHLALEREVAVVVLRPLVAQVYDDAHPIAGDEIFDRAPVAGVEPTPIRGHKAEQILEPEPGHELRYFGDGIVDMEVIEIAVHLFEPFQDRQKKYSVSEAVEVHDQCPLTCHILLQCRALTIALL